MANLVHVADVVAGGEAYGLLRRVDHDLLTAIAGGTGVPVWAALGSAITAIGAAIGAFAGNPAMPPTRVGDPSSSGENGRSRPAISRDNS